MREVSRMWVSSGGVFREAEASWVSAGGVFRETGLGDTPELLEFYSQRGVYGYYQVPVTWSVRSKSFDAGAGDMVTVRAESATGRVITAHYSSLSGTEPFTLGSPSTEWTLKLYLRLNGVDTLMGFFTITTAALPAPTDPQVSQQLVNLTDTVNLTFSWASVPYASSYLVKYYIGSREENNATVAQSGSARTSWTYTGARPNVGFGVYIFAVLDDGVRVHSSEPNRAYISGTTVAGYTAGTYEVDAQQKRTLIIGDKKTPRGWRDASNDQIFHGHGGDWNEHGTQVGYVFYWPNKNNNPFDEIRKAIAKGARVTRLQIRLNRSNVGNNVPIRPIVRTHNYKDWPGDGNTERNTDDNWDRIGEAIDNGELKWVDLDPKMANQLIKDGGGGIALGSTARKQEDYMAFWKNDTGKLRFKLE